MKRKLIPLALTPLTPADRLQQEAKRLSSSMNSLPKSSTVNISDQSPPLKHNRVAEHNSEQKRRKVKTGPQMKYEIYFLFNLP
jgi:hypothetical protein